MGGKTSTSTSQVSIPPDVLARYNAVNSQAQATAAQPFRQYSTDPNAFVAPINSTQNAGINAIDASSQEAQPYYGAATGTLEGAYGSALPYYGAATDSLTGAQQVGAGLGGAAAGTLGSAYDAANSLQNSALGTYSGAYDSAQPYNAGALGSYVGGLAGAQPLQTQAAQNIQGAQGLGTALGLQSLGTTNAALGQARPINYGALSTVSGGLGAAQPFNAQAASGYNTALGGAQPYQSAATGLAAAGAGAVNAQPLDINQYLSPYLKDVAQTESGLLNQQNQQALGGQLGDAIRQGSFGGDRAGIAAANTQQQLELANANVLSNILNTGYNTALGTAQQQQGVNLSAGQANRSALQTAAGQLQGIGQQGYEQGTNTAQLQAALGNQIFGQGQTAGTNEAAIGNQIFGQGLAGAQQQGQIGQNLSSLGLAAASQQAGLGSQVFGQGQTLGQNLQSLGQQNYTQGMGLGSAQQGLAAQQFGQGLSASQQQAALSQLLYGQGLSTSQQQAALGQGLYGMGSEQAQGLASLGSGAQAAGLQGGQAQLGAGQVQQQTQQAGDTALYNQFLQQQSYPFQVDQFLANIAEGTGALSGSTTTTTQPGGLFSDERLKEGIEPIGETFDHQRIVKFRYKGDPTTRIGLIAQDVEKREPKAVGLAAGFKTVDYDQATRKAAERGHFRGGGLVPTNDNRPHFAPGGLAGNLYPPGVNPYDIAAMLQAQEQMYAPFSQTGGLYGGQAGGSPRGGSSYVPPANLPVSHLMVADAPMRQQPSVLSQINSATGLAGVLGKDYSAMRSGLGKAQGLFGQHSAQVSAPDQVWPEAPVTLGAGQGLAGASDLSDDSALYAFGAKRGGLIPARRHRDIGGSAEDTSPDLPYRPGALSLNIPDTQPNIKPLQPATPGGGQQGNGLGDIAAIGGDIAKILPMILAKRGGRIGYDDGGDVSDDGTSPPDLTGALALVNPGIPLGVRAGEELGNLFRGQATPSPSGKGGLGSALTVGSPDLMGLGGGGAEWLLNQLSPKQAQPPGGLAPPATPQAVTIPVSQQMDALRQMQAARSAPRLARHAAPTQALSGPITPVDTVQPEAPIAVQPQSTLSAADLAAPPNPDLSGKAPSDTQSAPASPAPSLMSRLAPHGSYIDKLLHGDPQELMPLLSFIAAAGTAPTQHLGTALAAGLGAGASSYMDVRQQLATQAVQKQQAALTQGQAYEAAQGSLKPPPGMVAVPGPGPNGEGVTGPDGKPWHYELQVNATDFGANPTTSTPQAAALAQATQHGPISTDYDHGVFNIGPSAETLDSLKARYGVDPSRPGTANEMQAVTRNPQLAAIDQQERARFAQETADPRGADNSVRSLRTLGVALGSLPSEGVAAVGDNFAGRTQLLNLYQTAANVLGVQPDPGVTADLNNAQIIDKIRALQGVATAHQNDERSASIANALTGVLPGGHLQKGAAMELWGQMMVQAQQARDLNAYGTNYMSTTGLAAGLERNFENDFNPIYRKEQQVLPDFFARKNPNIPSPAEYLMQHPDAKTLKAMEDKFGTGIGRYMQ